MGKERSVKKGKGEGNREKEGQQRAGRWGGVIWRRRGEWRGGGKCRGLRAAEVFIMTVITKERI